MDTLKLDDLERQAYRESFGDGLIDLFVGLALVWIGACWLWLEPIAAIAGVIPAALAPAFIPLRARIIEPRTGYVRWSVPRRRWERQQLVGLLVLGVGALLICAAAVVFVAIASDRPLETGTMVAALPAVLVLVPLVMVAIVTGLRRLWAYGTVLLAGGVIVAMVDGNPGWPLLAAGLVATIAGAALFARFLRAYPVRGDG